MLTRGLTVSPSSPVEREQFLQKMSAGRSRTLMASGGDEPVADGGGGGHSIFASALLSGLRQMERPRFTASELFSDYVIERVAGRADQTPVYNPLRNSGHESGDFVFTKIKLDDKSAAADTPPARVDAEQRELAFWNSVQNSSDAEDFKDYLARYPEGLYAGIARRRVAALSIAPKPVPTPEPRSTPLPRPTPTPTLTPTPTPIPTPTPAPALTKTAANSPDNTVAKAPGTASPAARPQQFQNSARMEFVWIPPGDFMMGSMNGGDDERPVHRVTISEGFYLGRYEVTQAQWQEIMGDNPSLFKGGSLPVERVSWEDAARFIATLNARDDGYTYRLPAESEWEYAARAGTTGDYAGDLDSMAWYGDNSGRTRLDAAEINRTDGQNYSRRVAENGGRTHPVGTKLPNAFGLFDMHGNVWEWCQDYWHENYAGAPTDGSAWQSGGESGSRVLRGGSWNYYAFVLRSASRGRYASILPHSNFGFRVVAVARR
jgi:formylglycine-generating enzyme required for sulfatase activity